MKIIKADNDMLIELITQGMVKMKNLNARNLTNGLILYIGYYENYAWIEHAR